MQKIKKTPTANQAYIKYSALCARQECCQYDLAQKMSRIGMDDTAIAQVLQQLVEEGFIDETRYCHAFVYDKLHFSRWGRLRIRHELQIKKLPRNIIEEGLAGIDETEYTAILRDLLTEYAPTVKATSNYEKLAKMIRYAFQRGFEQHLASPLAESILN